jgi:hypothetical protein
VNRSRYYIPTLRIFVNIRRTPTFNDFEIIYSYHMLSGTLGNIFFDFFFLNRHVFCGERTSQCSKYVACGLTKVIKTIYNDKEAYTIDVLMRSFAPARFTRSSLLAPSQGCRYGANSGTHENFGTQIVSY